MRQINKHASKHNSQPLIRQILADIKQQQQNKSALYGKQTFRSANIIPAQEVAFTDNNEVICHS